MRTASFRDDVLWPIAQRIGLTPSTDLLTDEADAIASSINAWVRRLWDSADWPEWTVIGQFAPQVAPGLEHVVSWNTPPTTYIPPPTGDSLTIPDAPAPAPEKPLIGKVLKVYLVDPRTTWAPVDTPFRLEHLGIHCGFEHGSSVWIKYVSRAPKFTATAWASDITYDKDELIYSPTSGQCYKSKSNNNLNHDPSQPGGSDGPMLPLGVEETVGTQDNPGLPASDKIIDVFASPTGDAPSPIDDPPAAGVDFTIEVRDAANAFLGDATHEATGAESLLDIFTDLQGQLVAEGGLASFTITLDAGPPLKIRLQDASDFVIYKAVYGDGVELPLSVVQAQPFVEAVSPSTGTVQLLELTITDEQVVPGATYTLTFTTVDSEPHTATYTALTTDTAQQILSGLMDSVFSAQITDTFFTGVSSSIDTASPSATFGIDKTIGIVSLNAQVQPPGSSFWDIVLFPLALVDQVVRGAIADALGEQGQTDKQQPQEQAVKQEFDLRTATFTTEMHDPLTDQYAEGKRYR